MRDPSIRRCSGDVLRRGEPARCGSSPSQSVRMVRTRADSSPNERSPSLLAAEGGRDRDGGARSGA
eukprot:scaffold11655_cov121-Isochrysis_galbana.AAC.3